MTPFCCILGDNDVSKELRVEQALSSTPKTEKRGPYLLENTISVYAWGYDTFLF